MIPLPENSGLSIQASSLADTSRYFPHLPVSAAQRFSSGRFAHSTTRKGANGKMKERNHIPYSVEDLEPGAYAARFMCVFVGSLLSVAQAQTTFQVIKSLDGVGTTALIEGNDGNLYGTMEGGGSKGEGVVFKLDRDGKGYTVLHSFTG